MNPQTIIASLPWLRTLWRRLPRRLRFPLLVVAAVVWLYRRLRGGDTDPAPDERGRPSDAAAT